jgi:hypothetical protein
MIIFEAYHKGGRKRMGNNGQDEDLAVAKVPDRVFTTFVEALAKATVDEELVARLRKTLLVDHSFGDKALKEAIFPEVFDL